MAGCREKAVVIGGEEVRLSLRAGAQLGLVFNRRQESIRTVPARITQRGADCQGEPTPAVTAPARLCLCGYSRPGLHVGRSHLPVNAVPARLGNRDKNQP